MTKNEDVVPVTYADNWQVLAPEVGPLVRAFPAIHQFLDRCALPISPEKCWLWSAGKLVRQQLRQVTFGESCIPVRLQAVDLGADMRYSKQRAAARRNLRVQVGHRRLQRAQGLPGSKWQKSRLVMTGIWPQCLHGTVVRPALCRSRSSKGFVHRLVVWCLLPSKGAVCRP